MPFDIHERPPFPEVVDNTILNSFRSCPRQAFLTYFQHWKYATTNVHLHAGGAFARGLEVTRRAFFDYGKSPEEATALGLHALIEAYGNYDCPPDSAKSLERMCQALEYYFHIWPLETDLARPAILPSGKHAIEFSFLEPLDVLHPDTKQPILFAGRTDMIATLNGGYYIEDDKTTKSLGASWSDQWEMRAQFTGYCWAQQKAKILPPVSGVLIRGVAILKTKFDRAQHITYRAPWEIARWYEQTCRDIERMKAAWFENYWDFNMGEACTHYGGCNFLNICKSPAPEEWLPAYFVRKKWDPVTRTETEMQDE